MTMEQDVMNYDPKSISDHIDCLARLTGAPGSFVDQVRSLFVDKGISLDSAAGPFLSALEEAFRREESVRHTSSRAQRNIEQLSENFKRVGQSYVSQLSRAKDAKSRLEEQAQRLRREASGARGNKMMQVTIKGDHRTFVTRQVREELPMVPGPKELQ
jgi:hypothetical protein